MSSLPRIIRNELYIIIFLSSLALVSAAVWQVKEVKYWKAFQVERMLLKGQHVPFEMMSRALEQSQHLDECFLPGRHLHAPAFLGASLGGSGQDVASRTDSFLQEARESANRALPREPAVSSAWTRLAYFNFALDGPSPDVLSALKMSIYTAPAKLSLIYWRLSMAVQIHPYWDNTMAALVRNQVLLAWQNNPALLVKTAQSQGFLPIVRVVLANSPEQLILLETLAAKYQAG